MRKNKKNSIFAIAFTLLLVVSMLPFGIDMASGNKQPTAITVDKVEIDYGKFEREKAQIQARMQQQFGSIYEQLAKNMNFDQITKEQIIDSQLLINLLNKIGFSTGAKQLQQGVISFFGNNFSQELYLNFLNRFSLTTKEFEDDLSDKLKLQTFNGLLLDFVEPSKKEIEYEANKELAKIDLEYLSFEPAQFIAKVPAPSDEILKQKYEETAKEYEIPSQISYDYVQVSEEEAKKLIKISDQDLEAFYAENQDMYNLPEQINLGIIKLDLPTDGNPQNIAKVKTQADDITAKLKKGAKFSELATKFSTDPSKSKGGDLGWQIKTSLTPELAELYFSSLAIGVTKPIEKGGALYILDIRDYKPSEQKKFDDVKQEIITKLQTEQLPAFLSELANSQFDKLVSSNKTLKENIPNTLSKSLDAGEPIPGLDQAVNNTKINKFNLHELGNKFYITEIKEEKAAYIPDFSIVKEKVLVKYNEKEAKTLAENAAKEAVSKISDYAKTNKLELKKITTTKSKPEGFTAGILNEIYSTKESTKPYEFNNQFFVWKTVKVTAPEEKEKTEKLESIKSSLKTQNTEKIFRSIINSQKVNSDISIDDKLD